jgi:maltose alpha-D-glucosyltransferase/alpha-amylase
MLRNDRRRLELAFSLLFSLPGTPMMQYGDEIGMGDNLRLPERECARTPMQWTSEAHGGFSRARRVVRPVIDDAEFGYEQVNVAAQRRDPESLLNWTERMIRARRECEEISWGRFSVLRTSESAVLALRYEWRGTAMVTLHNFASRSVTARLHTDGAQGGLLVAVFRDRAARARADGTHVIPLEGYGWRWFRVGSPDTTLDRSELSDGHPGQATARAPGGPRSSTNG